MADEKDKEAGWRRVVKDIALVAGAITACSGAVLALYGLYFIINPYLKPAFRIILAIALVLIIFLHYYRGTRANGYIALASFPFWFAVPAAIIATVVDRIKPLTDYDIALLSVGFTIVAMWCVHMSWRTHTRLAVLEHMLQPTTDEPLEAKRLTYVNTTYDEGNAATRAFIVVATGEDSQMHIRRHLANIANKLKP